MDYSSKRQLILQGKMSRVLIILAVPLMLNNLIQTLYSLTDTFWISKLGSIEVAAMTFVWPVNFLTISLGMGLSVAGTALIAQYAGCNQYKEAKMISGQLFSFSLILSFCIALLGYFATPTIIHAMGGRGDLATSSIAYLSIMFLDVPPLFLFFIFGSIKQAQGDTMSPMILNVASALLNVILDPIFIFTLGLGIRGAAMATVISKLIFTFYMTYILFKRSEGIYLQKRALSLNRTLLVQLIKIGLPSTIGHSASAFGFIILNIFVVSYGSSTLAAFGIGNRINSLILMPSMGIGSALATVIGQNLGANQIERAKEAFRTGTFLTMVFMVLCSPILIYYSREVIAIFSKDMEVITQGTTYLCLISATMPFMGLFNVLIGTFQGSGHTMYSMFMDMGRLWGLRIPLILLLKHLTDWGPNTIWYAMIVSNGLICIFGLSLYWKGDWHHRVIKEEEYLG